MNWIELLSGLSELLPKTRAQQVTEGLSENNPYRQMFNSMSGTPTLAAINQAMDWDTQNRQLKMQETANQANYIPITEDMLAQVDPNNPFMALLQPGTTRRIDDINKMYDENSKYKLAPQLGKTANDMLAQMPDSPTKRMLSALSGVAGTPEGTGVFNTMVTEAFNTIPKPLTDEDRARIDLIKAQTSNEYTQNGLIQAQTESQRSLANYRNVRTTATGDGKTKKPTRTQIVNDHYNQLAAMITRYKRPVDYAADLQRNKNAIISKVGLTKYKQLVKAAEEADPSVMGQNFQPGKSSPMRYYINKSKELKAW